MDSNIPQSSKSKSKPKKTYDQEIQSKFLFNQTLRVFQCVRQKFLKNLASQDIGRQIPKPNNSYAVACSFEEIIYLYSVYQLSPQVIIKTYAKMTSYQIQKTAFYLRMRDRDFSLKVVSPYVYRIFQINKPYQHKIQFGRVTVFQCHTPLISVNWSELKKQCDKFAVVGNQEFTIFDIIE